MINRWEGRQMVCKVHPKTNVTTEFLGIYSQKYQILYINELIGCPKARQVAHGNHNW